MERKKWGMGWMSLTGVAEGLGMGLYYCYEIVIDSLSITSSSMTIILNIF